MGHGLRHEWDPWTVVIVWDDGRIVLRSRRSDDGTEHRVDVPPGRTCTQDEAERALTDLGWRRVDDWFRSGDSHAATVERIDAAVERPG